MADSNAEPKRWVLAKMIHAAIERTEAEIEELKAHGLFVRDASGPDDNHDAAAPAQASAPGGQQAGKAAAASTPPEGKPAGS